MDLGPAYPGHHFSNVLVLAHCYHDGECLEWGTAVYLYGRADSFRSLDSVGWPAESAVGSPHLFSSFRSVGIRCR
jgi:hypothetical protein